jgi:nucleotide-binding universal stress UspA family protein
VGIVAGVVVGVARATDAAASIRWASAEAALRGLSLKLVHAWNEPVDISVDLEPGALPGLRATATSIATHGRAADVLPADSPDLIVLGSHGDGHLSHLARACLRTATCPVVIVPDGVRPPNGRIVVGVCGDTSRDALRWAADEAHLRGARLIVVHAWQLHAASAKELLQPARAIAAHRDAAADRLSAWVSDVLGDDAHAELNAVHGGPLDVILRAGTGADLIVLGRSHHSGPGRIFHDGLGNDLAGLATCPIAFVHPRPGPA